MPYFLDSTPTWSTRGKLRNHLIPLLKVSLSAFGLLFVFCLYTPVPSVLSVDLSLDGLAQEMYGAGVLANLSKLAQQVSEASLRFLVAIMTPEL